MFACTCSCVVCCVVFVLVGQCLWLIPTCFVFSVWMNIRVFTFALSFRDLDMAKLRADTELAEPASRMGDGERVKMMTEIPKMKWVECTKQTHTQTQIYILRERDSIDMNANRHQRQLIEE